MSASPILEVIVRAEALEGMILAACEVFPLECYGAVFGDRDRLVNTLVVERAWPYQAALRARSSVTMPASPRARFDNLAPALPSFGRPVGEFHSHPASATGRATTCLGPHDAADQKADDVQFIVAVNPSKRLTWSGWRHRRASREITGTLAAVSFAVAAYSYRGKGKEARLVRVPILLG